MDSAERLPLNINILFEIVEKDGQLAEYNFDYEDEETMATKFCESHQDRVKHFYCSNHKTIFCRECIKTSHSDEDCFVVDLYEILRMR